MAADAYIGIGSNLEAPVEQVCQALIELNDIPHTYLTAQSSLYRSAPLGPADQPYYINAAAGVRTSLSPESLLEELQSIENRHGRIRTVRWGPRSLDLDLLMYGNLQQSHPDLTLPHPGIQERVFVLQPLYDIAPDLYIPGRGEVKSLLQTCPRLYIERLEPGFSNR
jgi:2-amino-4-hydroxy-6-hydroxymethyldihydropteridine diphosphokinase